MEKIINNQEDLNKWMTIATEYLKLNWSLIPIGPKKIPLVNWKEFQSKRAGIEEISQWLILPNFKGLAVVTGKISGVVVLDIDKGASLDGRKVPKSPSVKTGNDGWHIYFKAPEYKTLASLTGFRKKMDFRGEGGIIILPPSQHPNGNTYNWVKDRDLTIPFAEVPSWLIDDLKKSKPSNSFDASVIRGVGEGERNKSATQVVGKLLSHLPEEEWLSIALPLLTAWNSQNNPPLPEQELLNIYYSIARSEKEGRKEDEKEARYKKKDKSEKIFTTYSLDPTGVIDVLDDNGKLVYLTKDGIKDSISNEDESGDKFIPPPKEQCPYLFAQKDKVLELIKNWKDEDNDKLYEDLIAYHKSISDLPDEDYYHIFALWDIHTWLIEKCHYSPMLYFYAVKERGKSRTVRGILYVCMRGIFTETVREADIIRWANDHKAAIGFDVKDAANKIKFANCDDLFLSRFEQGGIASRTLYPERGAFADTKVFKLFGPTIIASNRPVDDILESRSISIDMKPSSKRFNDPVLPKNALELKNRLSAFRFVHFDKYLVLTEKPADGRLGDILSPLYQIMLTFFPEQKDVFLRLLKKIEKMKTESATDTYEGKIIDAVIQLKELVVGSKLPVDAITDYINDVHKMTLKNQTVGRLLTALGFEKIRITGGKRAILYDLELITKLAQQYGVSEQSDDSEENTKDTGNVIEQVQLLDI